MLVMISGDYHMKDCVKNDLDKLECCPTKYIMLVMISGDYHIKDCVKNDLDN